MKYFIRNLFRFMIRVREKRIMLLFGTMLLFTVSAFAQIEGDVADQKDQGIPNAIITATDTVRKFIDTVKSDRRGFYEFKNLRPGKYKIEAKASGFQPRVIENVLVNEGDTGAVKGEEDMYRGQRLNIKMTRVKVPK